MLLTSHFTLIFNIHIMSVIGKRYKGCCFSQEKTLPCYKWISDISIYNFHYKARLDHLKGEEHLGNYFSSLNYLNCNGSLGEELWDLGKLWGNLNEDDDKIDVPLDCLVIFHLMLVIVTAPRRWFIIIEPRRGESGRRLSALETWDCPQHLLSLKSQVWQWSALVQTRRR